MSFQNSINSSNVHFQNTSGTLEVAARLLQYPVGTTLNLGFGYSSPTFTIFGSDGTALSATNPAYVVLNSLTPNRKVVHTITTNYDFIDDSGASEITGNLFGLTTGVAYAQDLPFYLYAVTNDAENHIEFMISRVPHRPNAPALANIGAPDDAVADTQGSFWCFNNIDETLYDGNPCARIGAFRMQMSATDDWTVTALGLDDGIGKFLDDYNFTLAVSQFGAAAGSLFKTNGGTAPIWTTQQVIYRLSKDGIVTMNGRCLTNTTAGAGAVAANMVLPFAFNIISGGQSSIGGTYFIDASLGVVFIQAANACNFTSSAIASVTHANIGAGDFYCHINYLTDTV